MVVGQDVGRIGEGLPVVAVDLRAVGEFAIVLPGDFAVLVVVLEVVEGLLGGGGQDVVGAEVVVRLKQEVVARASLGLVALVGRILEVCNCCVHT